jgi:hypothetical protein
MLTTCPTRSSFANYKDRRGNGFSKLSSKRRVTFCRPSRAHRFSDARRTKLANFTPPHKHPQTGGFLKYQKYRKMRAGFFFSPLNDEFVWVQAVVFFVCFVAYTVDAIFNKPY